MKLFLRFAAVVSVAGAAVLLFSSVGTVAQDGENLYSHLRGIPQGNLTLRDAPASALLFLRGDPIGVVPENLPLIIEERREIKTLFGSQEWYRVRPEDGQMVDVEKLSGWVYNGKLQGDDGNYTPYINLVPVPPGGTIEDQINGGGN